MNKIKKLIIATFVVLSNISTAYAEEKEQTFNDNNFQLIEVKEFENNSNYNEYIFKNKEKSFAKRINNGETIHYEEFTYLLAEKNNARNSVSENISDISYALNATLSYSYTQSGSFTKMNYLKVSNIQVESGCTFKSAVAYLLNNGQGERYLYTNQYKSSTFTTTSGGTITGNSSWVPTTSIEHNISQGTGIMITFTIKRGTGTHSSANPGWRWF